MSKYDASSIQHLETREAMRTRIQAYLGSDDTEGIYQALKEIINNSTDEAIAGYGKEITIILDEAKNEITVVDAGRGVPFSTANGRNVLVEIYTESHTGGKFDKNAYKNSSGLNGLGGTAVCMSSEYFTVMSQRDNKIAIAEFYQGKLKNYTEKDYKSNETGTKVIFKPDKEVFKNMTDGFSYERVCREIKNISYLNKGVKFTVKTVNGEISEFYSENGIADFIKDKITKPLMKCPVIVSKTDGIDEVEIAFIWSGDKSQSYTFVNGLFCINGGSTDTGAKTAITNGVKKLIGQKDIDPDIIRRGLVYAVNCKVLNPSFSNQVKDRVVNPSLKTLTQQAFKEGLEQFANTAECNDIIEMIKKFQKAEKAADRAREAILNHNKEISKELKKKTVLAGKLADCRYHDDKSQLIIVEGLSALGGIVKSRNSDYTAAFPLTGKIQNVFKNTDDKLLANEVLKNLHTALGCGFGSEFNIKKLRYGRIVFVCDSDEDGYSIMCLLLAFMYKYYPQLISLGKVYWGQTPLFKVVSHSKVYYAYTDAELKKLPKGDITRAKGVGELEPDDFKATLFSQDGKYVPFTIDDAKAAAESFSLLLGENVEARREYIMEKADFDAFD